MKLLFFSDVHGVPSTLELLLKRADGLAPDKLVVLGDALYHGPRNGVPDFYDSKRTADIFNARRNDIIAVRGNCDAEVDQMMLQFPIMADFSQIFDGSRQFFLTHGHLWNETNLPNIPEGSVLAHGHTHIPVLKSVGGITVFNPGSISLPKRNLPQTFGFYDGKDFMHYDLLTMERLEF